MKSFLQKIIKADLDMSLPSINMEIDDSPIGSDDDADDNGNEGSILALLQFALLGEYQQWDLYTSYASRLKGLSRSEIADEFKDHAEEEQGHIEILQRYLVSLGNQPTLQRKKLPEMSDQASIKDIIRLQLKFEHDAVDLYKKILGIVSENEPLKIDIENIMIKEQEHVHDLELLLTDNDGNDSDSRPSVESAKGAAAGRKAAENLLKKYYSDCQKNQIHANSFLGETRDPSGQGYFRAVEPGEATKPQAGYGQPGCDCRCGGCKCSFLTKVDHTWCTQAMKELTPDIYARWYQGKLLTAQEKAFVVQAISLKWKLKDKRSVLRFLDSSKV